MKTSMRRVTNSEVSSIVVATRWRAILRILRLPASFAVVWLLGLLLCATPSVHASATSDAVTAPNAAAARAPIEAVTPAIAERLLRANDYMEKSQLDDALAVVDELASVRKLKSVDVAQIHRFRGYILVAKGEMEAGAREFEGALAQNAMDDAATQGLLYSLAQIHTQSGNYQRARDLLDRWFATEPNPKPEAFFLKAMVLVQQEAYADALEPARIANQRSSSPRESWLQLLAAIQFQLEDYPGVADSLRKLVAVAPGTKRYWVQLATIENTIGRDDTALATLGVAHVAGLLNEDREYRQRARLCFVRDLPTCCVHTLEEGLAKGVVAADAEAYQLLANCHIAARDTDKALEPLTKAGELSDNERSFLLLGQIELQKENFDRAKTALVRARGKADASERPSIDLLIGIAELGSGRYDDAKSAFLLAQSNEKTRAAAESYLKHLDQKRQLERMKDATAETNETVDGDPSVSKESPANPSNM